MAAQTKSSSGIYMIRGKRSIILPPCIIGYASLEKANTQFDPTDPSFEINAHFNSDQQAALEAQIEADVIEPFWEEFVAKGKDGGKDFSKKRPDAAVYLGDKLKTPKEGSKPAQYGDFIQFKVKELLKKKDGTIIHRTIKAYDAKNNLLDLPSLKVGMGSIVQVIVLPGLFANPLIKPQPSFQLQGIRILKLEQWGGSGPSLEDIDDSDLETLGEDFEAEDLSAFLTGANDGAKKEQHKSRSKGSAASDFDPDLDDEIPF